MASIALEEKITKIRLRNEEIKRRYEEVEADKKNAAELDALMKPVPSEDWPTRKEPPEFSAPLAKHTAKPKHCVRKHADQLAQHYTGGTEGKKNHTFADGQGPPPDPKYNFLADSEREERSGESPKDSERTRGKNKNTRGIFKRGGSGRDWSTKEHWNQHEAFRNPTHPEYDAWRAERNRIDEARISRQRTAEGNWRREWDNDKTHLVDDATKRENRVTLGEVVTRREDNDKEHYRSPRIATRLSHPSIAREPHQTAVFAEPIRNHAGAGESEKRVVIATEKSIKVLLNAQTPTPPRTSVMSVKVSPPNIAGSGRVGPRQRPRVTYSSQSEADASPISENASIVRQKSIDEGTRVRSFDQVQKITSPRSPRHQRKSDFKNSYPTRKEDAIHPGTPRSSRKESERFDETTGSSRNSQKSPYLQRRANPPNQTSKFSRDQRKSSESFSNDLAKSPRAQEKMIVESDASRGIAGSSDGSASTADSSSLSDKPNELASQAEANDDKNENACSDTQAAAEFSGNSAANDNAEPEILDAPGSSTAQKDPQSMVNDSPDGSKNSDNEKTWKTDSNDEANPDNSLDDIEPSDTGTPNCSVDSGVISNDSGYVELPSNDSIHDISDNEAASARENDGSPRRSMPSTSRAEEDAAVDEVREIQSASAQTNPHNENVNVELTSSNDFQAATDHLETQLFGEPVANSHGDGASDTGSEKNNGLESKGKNSVTMEEPAEVPQASEKPVEVPQASEESFEVPEAPKESVEVPQDSKDPAEVPQASEELVEVLLGEKQPAEVLKGSEEPTEVPRVPKERYEVSQALEEPTEVPQVLEEPIEVPQALKEPAKVLQVPKELAEVPQVPKEQAQVPQALEEPTEVSQAPKEPAEVPQVPKEPAEVPQVPKEPAQVPQVPKEPAQVPQVPKEPAEVPQVSGEPTKAPQSSEDSFEVPQASQEPSKVLQAPENPPEDPQDSEEPARVLQNREEPRESPQASGESKTFPDEEVSSTKPNNGEELGGSEVIFSDDSSMTSVDSVVGNIGDDNPKDSIASFMRSHNVGFCKSF